MATFSALGSPGCPCGCGCKPNTITVFDCDGVTPLPGATVTATKGSDTVGPYTTDASGQCSVVPTASGVWSVTASATNHITKTFNLTFTCTSSTSSSVTLKYFDCTTGWPATLTATVGGTAITVSGGCLSYSGSGSVPCAGAMLFRADGHADPDGNQCDPATTAIVLITFFAGGSGGCVPSVSIRYTAVNCNSNDNDCYFGASNDGRTFLGFQQGTLVSFSNSPVHAVFSLGTTLSYPLGAPATCPLTPVLSGNIVFTP